MCIQCVGVREAGIQWIATKIISRSLGIKNGGWATQPAHPPYHTQQLMMYEQLLSIG